MSGPLTIRATSYAKLWALTGPLQNSSHRVSKAKFKIRGEGSMPPYRVPRVSRLSARVPPILVITDRLLR